MPGTRLLIVDQDEEFRERLAKELSAEIVHVVNLVDRSPEGLNFGCPSTTLLNLPSESYAFDECPLCKRGMPLTSRGRTGKKMEMV